MWKRCSGEMKQMICIRVSQKSRQKNRQMNRARNSQRIRQGIRQGNLKALLCSLLFVTSLLLPGCHRKIREETELMVGAAASLKPVMEILGDRYVEKKEGIALIFTYASSGTLEQQIRQGAPMDVFLSASDKQIQSLSEENYLLASTITELTENRMVLIVPSDSALKLTGFEDITGASKIAIGEPVSVPAGKYACEVFEFYGLLEEAQKVAVYGKDVTEVLAWVSSGNVDAGVVYTTDAALSDQVTEIALAPAESHSRVVYPGAVVKETKQEAAAKEFLEYLKSEEAQRVFEEYGFLRR